MQQSREDYKDLMCTMETRFNYRIHSLENMSVSAKLAPPTLKIQNSGYTIIIIISYVELLYYQSFIHRH